MMPPRDKLKALAYQPREVMKLRSYPISPQTLGLGLSCYPDFVAAKKIRGSFIPKMETKNQVLNLCKL
jgi:hypothetical protein